MTTYLHILRTPMREVMRRQDGDERWCFTCRSRRLFDRVVDVPTDPASYYGPSPRIECTSCKTTDGDCFPGRVREWEG